MQHRCSDCLQALGLSQPAVLGSPVKPEMDPHCQRCQTAVLMSVMAHTSMAVPEAADWSPHAAVQKTVQCQLED